MPQPAADLLQGTLDVLVLKTLSWGQRHGYAIARWLEDTSEDALRIEEGSLYPALYRMELGRKAKFYRLTPSGRTHLKREIAAWRRLVGVVGTILEAAK